MERLKIWRKKNGYTQESLAFVLGCNEMTVWKWENGYTTPNKKYMKSLKELSNGYLSGKYFYE